MSEFDQKFESKKDRKRRVRFQHYMSDIETMFLTNTFEEPEIAEEYLKMAQYYYYTHQNDKVNAYESLKEIHRMLKTLPLILF